MRLLELPPGCASPREVLLRAIERLLPRLRSCPRFVDVPPVRGRGAPDPPAGINGHRAALAPQQHEPSAGEAVHVQGPLVARLVRLRPEAVCYAYFEYADLSQKMGSPWERFWGLFTEDRTPKLFIGRNLP